MDKRERELRQRIKKAGLTVEEFGYTGTNHYKVRLRNQHDQEQTLTFALTPSDRRNQVKQEAQLRRAARGFVH